ncbi:DJ-1/PfpI family protein [Massilia sp. CF038]|uniref:DJ-1/PfpI family protein n=1 Tax=Massilia sp. CF038 TaxID=1881045 RepID=UPI000916B560|nr:DJ-1/PfpI family protein [Massilia sp. CF038]SHH17629.1 DJ-1/PfpI family protein [Massilia sp. CF038]
MRLSILLFDGFTALDVVGGYEVLANVPGMTLEFAAARPGPVAADSGALGLMATLSYADLHATDLLYVPGGPGVQAALQDSALLACIERVSPASSWTIGICNGVLLLGAAGLLRGRRVTTNYFAREQARAFGAEVLPERFVHDGRLLTGAGVSSSVDTALYLAGQLGGTTLARTIQLGIEYYPAPPFGNGTPDGQAQALKDVVAQVERTAAQRLAARHIPF